MWTDGQTDQLDATQIVQRTHNRRDKFILRDIMSQVSQSSIKILFRTNENLQIKLTEDEGGVCTFLVTDEDRLFAN